MLPEREDSTGPILHSSVVARAIDAEMENLYETIRQNVMRMPRIHLTYLHVRNIANRYLKSRNQATGAAVHGTFEIVKLLRQTKGVYCAPWIHHITALAARTLREAADIPKHSISASAALRDLKDGLDISLFRVHKEKTSWDVAISESIAKKLESMPKGFVSDGAGDRGSLGQLADAAVLNAETAHSAGGGAGTGLASDSLDWSVMTTNGYLNALD